MPLRNVRVSPDQSSRTYPATTRVSYGEGPYFRIEMEYDPGLWDEYLFLGVEQIQQLHKATGALLAKRGLSRA